MTEILSNLLGEIVEVVEYEYRGGESSSYVRARGVARAIYATGSGAMIVIENVYHSSEPYGLLRGYDLYSTAVRIVRHCELCGLWDHPDKMFVREGETGANSAPVPAYECRKHDAAADAWNAGTLEGVGADAFKRSPAFRQSTQVVIALTRKGLLG